MSDAMRDKLANIIRSCVTGGAGNIKVWSERGIADAILAAGWRPPAGDAPRTRCFDCEALLVGPYCPKCSGFEPAERVLMAWQAALSEAERLCDMDIAALSEELPLAGKVADLIAARLNAIEGVRLAIRSLPDEPPARFRSDERAAARREALTEAAPKPVSMSTLRCVVCGELIPQGPFVVVSGDGKGPYHSECYDQPAPPDYRALCQELYGAARWLVDCKITVDGIDAVNDAWSKLRDALKIAEDAGVKQREEG